MHLKSKMKKGQTWLILAILILAFILRFWRLGKVPPSPNWDETALGYNAYSIMKTGRDEYGKLFPLILRSFDDYKPAIYAYLAILPIKIFGLNTFAVRFPSAFLGTLTVLLVYFLVKELFKDSKFVIPYSLFATFLFAISPWHLQFSRIAFESNVGLFFNILIAFFFLKGLKKPWLLILAAFFAGLNIYVYQAEKIFTPLLILAMALIWRKELFNIHRKYIALALVVGLVLILPFGLMAFTTPEIFLRAKGTSFAADITPFLARTVEKLIRDYQANDYLGLILDNRRITYALSFIKGYLSHLDLNWLFITGDEARHHAPGIGLLYLWELPFLLWGIYSLVFGTERRKAKLVVFSWFFLAPLPAAFTSGVPHAVRTLNFLPTFQIFVAIGLVSFLNLIFKKTKLRIFKFAYFARLLRNVIVIFAFSFFIFNFFYYLNQYFIQQNYFNSQFWQYGYKEAIEEINKIEGNYRKIVVSNQPHLDQSYMFFLFYLRYDPLAYQKSGGTVSGGFAETHHGFLKYTFRPIRWEEEEKTSQILYVGRPNDFPGDAKVIKVINFLDGKPAIKLVEG